MKSAQRVNVSIGPRTRSKVPAPKAFLGEEGPGRTIHQYRRNQVIFRQGQAADAIYYLQKGIARLSVAVSRRQKDATILLFGIGDFLGEDCVAHDKPRRRATATAVTDCSILKIERDAMQRALHENPALSDVFVSFLLARSCRIQEDLTDQLFSSSEKRLARTLLLLARLGAPGFGTESRNEVVIPHVSQQLLAEIIGATRQRVNFLMNRFRRLGFVDYDSGVGVHSSLLNVISAE